ncbi:MAG TPA: hypothetical protein VL550_10755 [Rhodocyclaceae bacterium]|jgi:hypothetical protein|nr:hypothetical protein [Rhodocyclaceae bacterium]
MKAAVFFVVTLFACVAQAADTLDRTPVEGTTANGEKVLLYPTGKWEYVNAQKAVEAKKVAAQYPENQVRPSEAQGGLFGVGRLIMPGDKDYNRGSLSGK